MDKTFNGTSLDTGWESVSSYYDKSSYGRLSLSFDITDKYITDQNASFYNSYENEDGYNIADELITVEAMQAIDSNIDFSKYDFNDDGIIDSVIFVYSVDHSTYDDDNNPWWAWVYVNEAEHHFDNKEFGYYMWVGYYFMDEPLGPGLDGNVEYNAETYIHEMGHLFGLDDYYEQDVEKYSFLGDFDMMDRNQGDHGPFNKLILGWIEPLIIEETGIYEITLDSFTNYESNLNNVLIIPKGNFDSNYGYSEYLAIIYYQPKGLYEKHLSDAYYNVPNKEGFIIYHINATLSNDPWYWEMFEYSNYDVGAKSLVRILEADQNNSLSGNNPINNDDILSSGSILLNSFKWHDGTTINVNISVGNLSQNDASLGVILSQN